MTSREPTSSSGGARNSERRVVTVLFCDVAGSTAMAAQLDPEDWTDIMDEAFDYLTAPVRRYGGTVTRLMGDAVLALFGAPRSHEDDPERAVRTGLSIVQGIEPFRRQIEREYGLDFNVRVGIHTGAVIVGEIGSGEFTEYTAMGDAANVAARMEQAASPGTVRISAETHRWVSQLFDSEDLGGIEVKGKSEPVRAYRVLREKAQPGSVRGIAGLDVPLVGRENEMSALRSALDAVQGGSGGIVCLIGEAGVGKSRIIEELRQEWVNRVDSSLPEDWNWHVLRSVSYDTTRPYGPWQNRIKDH